MQSFREGLIPFPHPDLLSLIDKSRDKNKYFPTCMHLEFYTTSVYTSCSTTTHIHWDLCQKIKIKCWVSMSRQEIYDPWPSIYWKRSDSALQFHLKAINASIPSYGKEEKEFNFERKVTLEKLFTSDWVCIPLSFKSEHSVHPPSSSLIDGEPLHLPYMIFPLVEDWIGGGPVGRNSVSWFWTVPTWKFVIFLLLLIIY